MMDELSINKRNVLIALKAWIIILTGFSLISFILIGFLPAQSNNPPYPSIENNSLYGHSILYQKLVNDGYLVNQNVESSFSLKKETGSVIFIIQPSKKYSDLEAQHIISLLKAGQPIVIMGTNEPTRNLIKKLGYDLSYDYIVDIQNYASSIIYPVVDVPLTGETIFVKPHEIASSLYQQFDYFNPPFTPLIKTSDSSMFSMEYKGGENYGFEHVIAVKDNELPLIIVGDGWNTANLILKNNENNYLYLIFLIKMLETNKKITKIIFEESTYAWPPTSKKGVANIYFSFFVRQTGNMAILWILWFVLPILLMLLSGIISLTSEKENVVVKNLSKRLSTLHLKGLKTLPLTLEERFILKQDLLVSMRGELFFSILAQQYLKEIKSNNLEKFIPEKLLLPLKILTQTRLPELKAWTIIENTVMFLRIIEYYGQEKGSMLLKQLEEKLEFSPLFVVQKDSTRDSMQTLMPY